VVIETRRVPAGAAVLRGDITEAIQEALIKELADVGYGRLSIEAVARRAGVGKTAVYRRWGSKLEMVIDAVASVASARMPLPDTGSLRGDLEIFLKFASKALRHRLASQIIPDLLSEAARNPQIASTLETVLHTTQQDVGSLLIGRAVKRGELPATVDSDIAVDLIVGPLYWRLAVARTPLPDAVLSQMTSGAVAALLAVAESNVTSPATASAPIPAPAPAPAPAAAPAPATERFVSEHASAPTAEA
jgi:AcrR family transcriptional regulator